MSLFFIIMILTISYFLQEEKKINLLFLHLLSEKAYYIRTTSYVVGPMTLRLFLLKMIFPPKKPEADVTL